MKENSLSLGLALLAMGILTVPLCDGDVTVFLFLAPVAIAQTWHAIKVRRRAARRAGKSLSNSPPLSVRLRHCFNT